MAPPMPNPTKRMTANPAKPVARYRPGKPVAEQESSDEEEVSEEEKPQQPQRKPPARPPPVRRPVAPAREESEEEDEDEEGFVTEEEDEGLGLGPGQGPGTKLTQQTKSDSTLRRPAPRLSQAKAASDEESEDDSEEGSSDGEESSEEEEEESSSSEDEAPQRKFKRPTFIRKTDRQTSTLTKTQSTAADPPTSSAGAADADAARRLAQADLLIKDKLERDALARAAGKKSWDDDDDILPESMVDDTDGLDPEAEHAAWKVRELRRLKRDREALVAREKEIEEIERRRNLTAEEREREDREFLEKQREERDGGRHDAAFLARYHHKGAFFQGDEAAEILKRRDVMGARFEDEVSDKSLLPEYMRIRDMTKLGKKGRTRYKDLKGEDTGRFGDEVKRWKGSTGAGPRTEGDFDTRGLDERFLPDDQRRGGGERGGRDRTGPTGANASAVGERRDRDKDKDRYRSRSRSRERRKRSYSKSRSRSRSPRRRRRDSPSPDRHRDRVRDRERDRDGTSRREEEVRTR
ncbi:hypothetical protein PV08_02025 [Exophiala spinifera]|uniref:Micro-fibrillar-associated protein 1 C-terminal domain-containing protein n=1 Tax=Exophiala spinifera TaxID=91928 RepID=A0A0D2BSP5_9EURO|nr:uncharacterized protein PV08_02025 [Exophiala spinifera]KIW21445.1 hypothetical protein PV08_02025 [Exophiala spinifera]